MSAGPAGLEKLSQRQADSRTVHRDSPGGETDLEHSKDTLTDKSADPDPEGDAPPAPPAAFPSSSSSRRLGFLGCFRWNAQPHPLGVVVLTNKQKSPSFPHGQANHSNSAGPRMQGPHPLIPQLGGRKGSYHIDLSE